MDEPLLFRQFIEMVLNGDVEAIRPYLPRCTPTWITLALKSAVGNGDLSMVKLLHSAGGDPEDNEREALFVAAEEGHLDVLKYFSNCGLDLFKKRRGRSLLDSTANSGNEKLVLYLLGRGVDSGGSHDFALCVAIQRNYLTVVQVLLEYGADPSRGLDFIDGSHYVQQEIVQLLKDVKRLRKERKILGDSVCPISPAFSKRM